MYETRMVGTYRLFDLPDARPTVQAWCHGIPGEISSPHRIVPFWYPSIVVWREWCGRGQVSNVNLRFHGPQQAAYVFNPERSIELIGVAIAPEFARCVLQLSNEESVGQICDWHDNRFDQAMCLAARGSAANLVIAAMANAVGRALCEEPFDEIDKAIAIIRRAKGTVSLRAIRERVEISERYFRTRFKERVGISAKGYSRLLRANALIASADNSPNPRWAELSNRYGYFDQAHMINDLRHLTGRSPVHLIAERQAEAAPSP